MHPEVFNGEQHQLLPLLSKFRKEYFMVDGTAIALHIGHRFSIDFDLFKNGAIRPRKILEEVKKQKEKVLVTLNRDGQLNYFDGISFEEQVEFMPGFEVSETEVKEFLTDAALSGF